MMTPQERKLLNELFDRLASLESAPRDPDAVEVINDGLTRAPNALYPLVQSVLVQDEALKRADARIRELEGQLGIQSGQPAQQQQPSFLDNMRSTLFGNPEPRASVPTVRPGVSGSVWGAGRAQPAASTYAAPPAASAAPPSSGGPFGGSFLGTAAASAAGVVGGALLMNSFRGMFGGNQNNTGHAAFDSSNQTGSPWAPSNATSNANSAANSDLARQAGVDDIGRNDRASSYDNDTSQRSSLLGSSNDDDNDIDGDTAGDLAGDMGGDLGGSDTA